VRVPLHYLLSPHLLEWHHQSHAMFVLLLSLPSFVEQQFCYFECQPLPPLMEHCYVHNHHHCLVMSSHDNNLGTSSFEFCYCHLKIGCDVPKLSFDDAKLRLW
jgi:hypothetical protein